MAADNWLSRTEMLIGRERLEKLRTSNVLVAGLGGVGAFTAEAICRAGVGNITIVDGDKINSTNRNRQLPALRSTEGIQKTEIMENRLKDINPEVNLTVINEFIKDERIEEILDSRFDYVVDAIDTLSPKFFLIYNSYLKKYPIVSSMGAGGKFDPSKITICDISETKNCPLARDIRKRLHHYGIEKGITAVYSPEVADKSKILTAEGEMNKASIVGTISYMPGAFGLFCASVVIRDLAGIPR